MDSNQITGLLRIVLPLILAVAVSRGWLTSDQSGPLTDAIVAVVGGVIVIWSVVSSFIANSKNAHLKSVEAMKDVKVVVGPAAPAVAQEAAADPTRPKVETKVLIDPGPPPVTGSVKVPEL